MNKQTIIEYLQINEKIDQIQKLWLVFGLLTVIDGTDCLQIVNVPGVADNR